MVKWERNDSSGLYFLSLKDLFPQNNTGAVLYPYFKRERSENRYGTHNNPSITLDPLEGIVLDIYSEKEEWSHLEFFEFDLQRQIHQTFKWGYRHLKEGVEQNYSLQTDLQRLLAVQQTLLTAEGLPKESYAELAQLFQSFRKAA